VAADALERPAVELREVTAATVRAVCGLDVAPEQRGLVAPNAVSIAEAYFEPAAWFRAIQAGDALVGFAMLYDPTRTGTPDEGPEVCFLWRFMIDAAHQRRGHGLAALRLLVAHARTLPGVTRMRTSFVPRDGNAGPVYARAGFRPTGEVSDGEVVLELPL
jgi:diamine N-acetyltransferase